MSEMETTVGISQIDCDVRAEVIAANLIENIGVELDAIAIINKGNYERKYRKDILGFSPRATKLNNISYFNFDVSRPGLYDLIPQGFFHGADPRKTPNNTDAIIELFKKNREEEEALRLYFLPIEKELSRLRILVELAERNTLFGLLDRLQDEIFFALFPDIKEIDEEHRAAITQVIPIVHKIRGNPDLIALLCEFLFSLPARVKNLRYFTTIKNDTGSNRLGSVYVGENFVPGNFIPDYSAELEVEIGPMQKSDAVRFLPGESFDKIISFIKDYLLPFDSELKLTFVFAENQKYLYLRDLENADRIGLTSYI
jgi:hypothetical protein